MQSRKCRIFFIVFSCVILLGCETKHRAKKNGTNNKFDGKIVGGTPVPIESFPFAVQFINLGRLCGGVIIHSWAIITAGHCLAFSTDTKEMIIQAGAKYAYDFHADTYRVLTFVIHEDYNKTQAFSCDIALVFSVKPIKFGDKVKKGILVNNKKWMDKRVDNFIVIGWGFTKEGGDISKVGLQMTHLRYVSTKKCSKLHKNYKLTLDMFCLYGDGKRDACQGDSGGGVLWNGFLVGLTSHGIGCARKDKPTVYSNLWVLRKWIINSLKDFYAKFCKDKFTSQTTDRQKKFIQGLEIF